MAITTETGGIKFFTDRDKCIESFEKSSWTTYALQVLKSYGTSLIYGSSVLLRMLKGNKEDAVITPLTSVPKTGFSKHRLIVCLHGRNSHPRQFTGIVDEMLKKKKEANADIYIPHIIAKGKEKLDVVVPPIFDAINQWAKQHADKELELTLIGISNGGRIARALDAQIGKINNIARFRFISIVGACRGSSMANTANTFGIGRIVGEDVHVEMPVDSKRNQQLDKEWTESLQATPKRQRHYVCLASPHDFHVPNFSSTLLDVPVKATKHYAIVPGHGHNSIIDATTKAVVSFVT